MDLRALLSAVLAFSISTPLLADLDHRPIRIAGYEMVSHLLVYNNPNLGASLSDHGAYRSAYSARLDELEILTSRAGNEDLTSHFNALKSRVNALEASTSADQDRLANWVNPILEVHTRLDSMVAAKERMEADGNSPVSNIMLGLARINFYYQLRTFSTLSVPLLRDSANPIETLDAEIIKDFAEAQRRYPNCSKGLSRSVRDYRFIRPGLLDRRSAWVHDSVHRYTSSISSRLAPMLKDGSCRSGEVVTAH